MATSASGINFTGLASGVDTSSIVTQLMSIERAPLTRMSNDMSVENARKAALQDISTKLLSLRTAADSLRSIPFWAGTPHGSSGDDASYSLSVTSGAPKASYQIQVKQLATGEVWAHNATSGVRDFPAAMAGLNTFAGKTTALTSLTDGTGASLGLQVGQQISMSGLQGGAAYASETPFTVTATSTLDDLRSWIQGQVPGSTISIETGGRIRVKSPVGSDQEMTSLALSTGGAAAAFDTAFGTSAQVGPAATGDGKIDADDTLHITAGGVTANVVVTTGMSMAQVATAVNATNGGVIATVVDGKLRLSAKDTGVTGGTVAITSDGATATALGFTKIVAAQNAVVGIDGVDQQSESNAPTTLIAGATLILKQTSALASTGSTDPTWVDRDDAAKRASDFVDAYNSVMDTITARVTEQKVRQADAQTLSDLQKGVLFNSSALQTVQSSLREALADTIAGLAPGSNLANDVGISTGTAASTLDQDAIAGRLKFDRDKFLAAFDANRDSVRSILTTDGGTSAGDGIAQRISDLTLNFTKTGGVVAAAIDGSTDQVKRIQDQIDQMNLRLDAREAALKAQFTAMETAIAQLKSAGDGLTSSLSSLNANNGSN
jgi:flagellar hook-associated protein 2